MEEEKESGFATFEVEPIQREEETPEKKSDSAQNIAYTCISFAGGSALLLFAGAWIGFDGVALGYLSGLPLGFGTLAVGGKLANNAGEAFKSWARGEHEPIQRKEQ